MCEYCKAIFNDQGTNKSLLPIMEFDFCGNNVAEIDTFITSNSELELCAEFPESEYRKILKVRIDFCPMCGANLKMARK